MTARRILVVVGHPIPNSFGHAMADAYANAAESAGAHVRRIDLSDHDRHPRQPTQSDQLRVRDHDLSQLGHYPRNDIESLEWAEHIAIFFPQWWGTYPGVLKTWIDHTFLSGATFRYLEGHRWERLLTGRTARLVMTMDSPGLWNRLVYRDAAIVSLRRAVLGYCGIKTRQVTRVNPIKTSSIEQRNRWLANLTTAGSADGSTPGRRVHTEQTLTDAHA